MSKLEKHNVLYIDAKHLIILYESGKEIIIEQLGIIFNSKYSICRFLFSEYSPKSNALYVNNKSINKKRIKFIKCIIEDIIIPSLQLGKSYSTIENTLHQLESFINFCNINKIEFYKDISNAKEALRQYSFHLKQRIRNGSLSYGYAYILNKEPLLFLKKYFNVDEGQIASDIEIIISKNTNQKSTQAPNERDVSYSINFYYNLFQQISDFILNQDKYPFEMKLPNIANYYIIPSKKVGKDINYVSKYIDFKTGLFIPLDEVEKSYASVYVAKEKYEKFHKKIELNNCNFKTEERLHLASIALKAYFMHFLALTGMNDSTAATLQWNDDYEIEKSTQSFKNIKYRAGNKLVEFKLQSKAIKDFKKFLHLREYLLANKKIDYLFFSSYKDKVHLSNFQKSGSFSSSINETSL